MAEENQGAAGVESNEAARALWPEATGRGVDMNCLSYWFPILHKIEGIKFPNTGIVNTARWPNLRLELLLDGKHPGNGYDEFLGHLRILAHGMMDGKGRFFLRTGQLSGKHSWRDTCFLNNLDDLEKHVCMLIEESAMAGFLGLPMNIWVVREFLPLAHEFTAFNGMPVAKEIRFFVEDGKMKCWHWYWPEWTPRRPNVPNWIDLLRLQQQIDFDQVSMLRMNAETIGKVFGGAWSVDMAMHTDGTWYVIDMALAKDSFHWIDCPNCPPEMRERYKDAWEKIVKTPPGGFTEEHVVDLDQYVKDKASNDAEGIFSPFPDPEADGDDLDEHRGDGTDG